MTIYEYEITKHPAETFRNVIYFCSEAGQCSMDEVTKDDTRTLTTILNNHGKEGWELIQVSFGKDGIMAFWKRALDKKRK
jgi:hypothetical protein